MKPKTQSIFSYLGFLWLIPYFAGKNQRDDLSRYHLKQGLGLLITLTLFTVLAYFILEWFPGLEALLNGIVGFVIPFFIIVGMINASYEAKRPLPLIGKFFEEKFPFIDKT